jgi:predicted  nucleic acid-binding Zn-ribbon protein
VATAPFDTLKLARALRDKAGFSQEHAEAAADAFAEIVTEQVATKQDIHDLQTEIDALRTEMRSEFAAVRSDIATLRSDMAAGFREVEQRMTIRLGGMLVVLAGILLAAKFFG